MKFPLAIAKCYVITHARPPYADQSQARKQVREAVEACDVRDALLQLHGEAGGLGFAAFANGSSARPTPTFFVYRSAKDKILLPDATAIY